MAGLDGIGQSNPRTSSVSGKKDAGSPRAASASSSRSNTAGLSSGQTITGKIVSIASDRQGGSTAQVDLQGRGTVQAKLQDGMGLKEGQNVSFEVRSNSGRELTLSPLLENTAIDPTVLKALAAAGLSVTDTSLLMVKDMMESGMGIDRNSLLNMSNNVNSNPGVDISTIVQLTKAGIPINEENITQYESYRNYEHQILNTLDDIMDNLAGDTGALVKSGDTDALVSLFDDLTQIIEGQDTGDPAGAVPGDITGEVLSGETEAQVGEALEGEMPQNGTIPETAASLTEESSVQGSVTGQTLNAMAEVPPEESDVQGSATGKIVFKEEEVPQEEEGPIDNKAPGSDVPAKEPAVRQDPAEDASGIRDRGYPAEFPGRALTKSDLSDSFINTLKELGVKGETAEKLYKLSEQGAPIPGDDTIDAKKLLKEISDSVHSRQQGGDVGEAVSKLFSENSFNTLLKRALSDKWTLDPSEAAKKENVEQFYRQLAEDSAKLSHTLARNLGAESGSAQSAGALSDNLDFMNQLNHMFGYIQLPIKTADGEAHGDLYVYANKKKKFTPGDSVSAVLHLDMQSMGAVDVFVRMTGTKVRTNFYVEDDEIIDLINEHIDELNSRLEKRGYSMETRLALHSDMDDPSDNPAVDEMLGVKKHPVISFTSFDARA